MRSSTALCAAFATLLSLHPATAFFVIEGNVITQQRIDPVVNFGTLSSHTHTIIGPSNINAFSTYETLQQAGCTSTSVTKDLSAYWQPTLYYHNPTDKSYTVIPSYAQIYYLNRPGPKNEKLVAFPPGFRMVAGSPMRSSHDPSSFKDQAIDYVCLGVEGPQSPSFFKHACPGGLRAQVVFPSCWNGVDLYKTDNSHVAYPIQNVNGGDCPASHPVHFITLFQEFIYDTGKFPYNNDGPTWVLATGDATGYSLHADFLNGWDTDVLQAALDQCTGMIGGNLNDCPPLRPFFNPNAGRACRMAVPVLEEQVGLNGPVAQLPGCNTLYTSGGRPACSGGGSPAPGTTVANPSTTSRATTSLMSGRLPTTSSSKVSTSTKLSTSVSTNTSTKLSTSTSTKATTKLSTPSITSATVKPTTTGGTAPKLPAGWRATGCIVDKISARTISGYYSAGGDMTIPKCVGLCNDRKYTYAGIEYGIECFCGNTLRTQASSTACNMPCAGARNTICGGQDALSLFSYTAPKARRNALPLGGASDSSFVNHTHEIKRALA